MLEKLALKHSLWVKMAKGICKDAYLADDLVSEMYLKLSEYDKELNDYYVYFTIKHLFVNWLREESKYSTEEIKDNFVTFEENKRITFDIPDCVTWVEKQILILRQDYSGHDIARKYKLHYGWVYRTEKQAKEKLKEWAKENRLTDLVT